MKIANKKTVLVISLFVLCLFAATSCTTQNPPVNAYTGATTTTPKK